MQNVASTNSSGRGSGSGNSNLSRSSKSSSIKGSSDLLMLLGPFGGVFVAAQYSYSRPIN